MALANRSQAASSTKSSSTSPSGRDCHVEAPKKLDVDKEGNGKGTVTSSPAGVDCGKTCDARFPTNTTVTLTATPASGSTFVRWSDDCTGTSNVCTVSMSRARDVTAKFMTSTQRLTVSKKGDGKGTVTSSPSGINCGSTCSASFDLGRSVTLTASPAGKSKFAGWSGACSGTKPTCTVKLDQARSVTAKFV